MSDSADRITQAIHQKRITKAEQSYEKYKKYKERVSERNAGRDKTLDRLLEEHEIRMANRVKNTKEDKKNELGKRRLLFIVLIATGLFLSIVVMERIVPGSRLKKKEVVDDTPIDQKLSIEELAESPCEEEDLYAEYGDSDTEEKILYNLLMEHFDGNKNAVLGVMCNLKAESKFLASNLEDYNNEMWGIGDAEYTEKVNRKTISQKDFLESRLDNSNGYYNDYDQWVNLDGGYGYAQYTSYEKKKELYDYAEMWFGPGGKGEGLSFNIGDPKMQANYVIYLLESDSFKSLDDKLKGAPTVVDACYAWLNIYEVPYDPYGDGYYTLAFDRAEAAEEIEARCENY